MPGAPRRPLARAFLEQFFVHFLRLQTRSSRRPIMTQKSQISWPAQCFVSFFDLWRARLYGLPRGLTFSGLGGRCPNGRKSPKIVACAAFLQGCQRFVHGCARQATYESSRGRFPRRRKSQKSWPAHCFRDVCSVLRTAARGRPLARALG